MHFQGGGIGHSIKTQTGNFTPEAHADADDDDDASALQADLDPTVDVDTACDGDDDILLSDSVSEGSGMEDDEEDSEDDWE